MSVSQTRYPHRAATSAAGGLPPITSWRQWGHSHAAAGYDQQSGKERHRGRITERVAGMLHLDPSQVMNEAVSGSSVMPAYQAGFSRILQRCVPRGRQEWPWEVDRFGVECSWFGVNDVGTGGIQNSGSYWASIGGGLSQGAMWALVWANTQRSIISRFIAGAVYAAADAGQGLPPALWHSTTTPPTDHNPGGPPGQNMVPDFAFIPQGASGVGLGGWQFRQDTTCNSGTGYWWTPNNGDKIIITVPQDFDTGTITLRHLCPGSWFDGPVQVRNPFGTVVAPGTSPSPTNFIVTGQEHPRAASAVTVTGPGIAATVNCRGLANRMATVPQPPGVTPPPGTAGTPGTIPVEGAMTHVSRHALTPIPGTTQQVVLTVGGLPAGGQGGWYGFDSFEIEARPLARPLVLMCNVADPASWATLYGFGGAGVWPMATAQAIAYSDALAAVVAEFADPGIAVVDLRSALKDNPIDYAELVDTHITNPAVPIGDVVESSGSPTMSLLGDGTHPHMVGEKLAIGEMFDTVSKMDIDRGRTAIASAPGRSLAYTRSSSA